MYIQGFPKNPAACARRLLPAGWGDSQAQQRI